MDAENCFSTFYAAAESAKSRACIGDSAFVVARSGNNWVVRPHLVSVSAAVTAVHPPTDSPKHESTLLEVAIAAEAQLERHRASYLQVCRLYSVAAESGSEEARRWLCEQGDQLPMIIPKAEPFWAESPDSSAAFGSSLVRRETFYDGFTDDASDD